MRRLLAIVGAIAMIGAAVLIRGAITSDGGGGGGGGSGDGSGSDGDTHLICATELEAACQALAEEDDSISFDVEEAGVTAERLVDPAFRPSESDIDGWLTLNPWPQLVNDRRHRANLSPVLATPSDVLATSQLDVVGPTERLDALDDACTGPANWRCYGELAGQPWSEHGGEVAWGEINVGHADPTKSATGLLVLGLAAAEYFGAVGGSTFASNDFDLDLEFRPWLSDLEGASPRLPSTSGSPLDQLLFSGVSSWDAVGDIDWVAKESVAGTRDEDALSFAYPSFMLAEAVAAPIVGHQIPDFTDDHFRGALDHAGFANAGWDPDPSEVVSPINAGVYEALIQEWELAA